METLHDRCAGLDVYKDTVVACVRIVTGRSARREVKTFATTTSGLLELLAEIGTRKKDSYFRTLFHRLKAHRGPKKAIVAVAASILTTVHHLLRDGTLQDLGPSHFDVINRDRAAKSLVRRLNALGFDVDVRPTAA